MYMYIYIYIYNIYCLVESMVWLKTDTQVVTNIANHLCFQSKHTQVLYYKLANINHVLCSVALKGLRNFRDTIHILDIYYIYIM